MRINKLTDYSVVVLVDMTRNPQVRSAHQIAAETGVPLPTVAKIMKALTRDGLVVSQRGAAGGYALGRLPERITVADMIQAIEGPIALTSCVGEAEHECGIGPICPMQGQWHRVNDAVRQALGAVTLAEMAGGGPPLADHNRPVAAPPMAATG
ncbi:SUF system Fe-S cluster assembly regulator [Roseospirillum parvum]|uniref:FeS assembly SUF system regulator n=1 Tax=Roseospirillum parvum TaxID=83401 RepID=A0A1G7UJI4_9PROT|nr:SUF system Fe-S cluster assembly regulator [Roseospirillum parvum]SDG47673.1 FeS assembly SUF system regulator [Roseospirillum parvum]